MPDPRFASAMAETSLDALYAVDGKGRIVDWSWGAQQLFGWARGEMVGTAATRLAAGETGEADTAAALREAWETGHAVRQWTRRGREGGEVQTLAMIRRWGRDGDADAFLTVSEQDRTEQHRLTENLQAKVWSLGEARAKLEKGRAQLAEAERLAHVGSWEWDVTADQVSWSDELYRLLGLTAGAAEPTYATYMRHVHPGDRVLVETAIQRCLESRHGFALDHRIARGTGEVRWIHATGTVARDVELRAATVRITAQDVTERKLAEQEMSRRMDQLRRSNEELQQLAYVVSHDLQEPLRAVGACVDVILARHEAALDPEARQLARFAVDETAHMKRLVGDLLAYARLDFEPGPPVPVDAGEALARALHSLSAQLADTRARVTNDALPVVLADPSQLSRVFQNLVGNALKFRRMGEPPQVHVEAKRQGEWWVLSVSDNGLGIDPAHGSKLFRVFGRLHAREEYPGTGIGLALCKKIVESHGGRIWFDSASERGTTFRFTVRAPEGAEILPPQAEPSGNEGRATKDRPQLNLPREPPER